MDCFQDFCLACDKQCTEGSYCSQACRLADIEKASNSSPSSPSSHWATSPGFHLAPAYGFPSPSEKRLFNSSPEKSLTPSSSRTSLSSTTSSSGNATSLSKQARAELQEYYSFFDQTRAAKRRSSLR